MGYRDCGVRGPIGGEGYLLHLLGHGSLQDRTTYRDFRELVYIREC